MSGKHRRPEPDPLPDADVAARMQPGPVVEARPTPATAPPRAHPAPPRQGRRRAAPPEPEPSAGPSSAGPSAPTAATAPVPDAGPGSAPAVAGPTVVARRSRQTQRQARRAQQRRRLALLAAALVGVLLVGAGGWWLVAGRDDGSGERRTGDDLRQQTVLVQVAGADGTAVASALLGVRTDAQRAAAVLVPSRLIVDVAGAGQVPFGETLGLPDAEAPAKALTDLLGVDVGGGWVLTQAGLASLVDAVGGVQAEVDVDVVVTDAEGAETVVVQAGSQRLTGEAAAAYATYAAPEEPEQARLARFYDVLDGVLRGLPDQRAQVRTTISSLADGSRSTLPVGALAELVTAAHAVAEDDDLLSDVLPVNPIDTGTGTESYGVNAQQAAALMQARFPQALVEEGQGDALRVLVQNGVGTPGLVDRARSRLVDAGFRFVNGGNAPDFDNPTSRVVIPDATQASQERGRQVAAALGLPATSVELTTQGQTVADVIVVLGRDFRP